jgi:hypothetical protein
VQPHGDVALRKVALTAITPCWRTIGRPDLPALPRDHPVITTGIVVNLTVLAAVLLLGVAAGRAKGRWTLLLVGLVGAAVLGIALTASTGVTNLPADTEDPAVELAALYSVTVPLAVAFLAGWLCGRASWARRLVVVVIAALVLAAFPYQAAGRLTAERLAASATQPAAHHVR